MHDANERVYAADVTSRETLLEGEHGSRTVDQGRGSDGACMWKSGEEAETPEYPQ